ncbi:MAG: NADH-quinone oxidoreductase subunit N [Pseudomonadota bacterium]
MTDQTGIAGPFELSQLFYQAPFLILAVGGLAILLLDAFAGQGRRSWLMWLAVSVSAAALASSLVLFATIGSTTVSLFGGMLALDRFSVFLAMVVAIAALLCLLLSSDYLHEHRSEFGEYYSLVLLAASGMVLLAMATDLITVFLGIETMSLAVYVLTGSFRRCKHSAEGALKYFLCGALASAFLLYGIALVYGATGTTNLRRIGEVAAGTATPLLLLGELMLIVAFGFKIALVPFHMWAPDAYQGAPTPVTAFMAAGVKAAGFAALLRLFLTAFGSGAMPFGHLGWGSIFAVLAAITMTFANIAALRQENFKRLLAYSSVSHAGYLLIGVVAAGVGGSDDPARSSLLFYIVAYTFATIGAFGLISWIGKREDERLAIEDWAGLASRHPKAALAMTIFLLSLAGMPPTAGFFAKFYVFRAAMGVHGDQLLWLVIVAVLNSVIAVYYYLRPVVVMYFREPTRDFSPLRSPSSALAITIAALFVLQMGLLPGWWLDLAGSSGIAGLAAAAAR